MSTLDEAEGRTLEKRGALPGHLCASPRRTERSPGRVRASVECL